MIQDGRVIRFSEAGEAAALALAFCQTDGVRGRAALACALEPSVFATQWANVQLRVSSDPPEPIAGRERTQALFTETARSRPRTDECGLVPILSAAVGGNTVS